MKNKRYCTKCNSELEILEVDGRPCQVCKSCSCIEPGYVESEKEIVLELQDYFKSELWRVMFVMGIFRAHLTPLAPDRLAAGGLGDNPLQSSENAEVPSAKHGGR